MRREDLRNPSCVSSKDLKNQSFRKRRKGNSEFDLKSTGIKYDMPIEPEEKKDVPPTETRCQGQGPPPPGGGSDDASVSEERPKESSKSPPDSSSTSSSPESDLDLGGRCRNKELRLRLSPESVMTAKRCLWDVDRKEVDESLTRELKRIRQEESVVKSKKWNFDFEKEVPIRGSWHWEKAEEPPDFYKTKIYPSKRSGESRVSPYERPPKRRSLEAVSSSRAESTSSDMTASSSTSSASSLSSHLVSTSSELSVLASKISSISSTTKDCEKSSPVQMASETSDIFEGKEKSSKDSLSLVVASSSSVGSSSSFSSSGDDRSATLPSSKTSRARQEKVKSEQPISKASTTREDTPTLSTCTNPFSVCSSIVNVSSSDSSKASASKDNNDSSSSNNRNNNGQNVSDIKNVSSSSTCQTSSSSGTTSGIVPSQFYSVESDEGNTTSSTSSDPLSKTKEKGKVPPGKPPKPPNPTSGESSSSHLLKYYR
ncbi:UNVERIFIED_CONTAM: hypothetical protein RMT77_013131 [Armadillidium vulgare]